MNNEAIKNILDDLYNGDYKFTQNDFIAELFAELCDDLICLSKIKAQINIAIIESPIAQISVKMLDDNSGYLIIWNNTYWDFYKEFVYSLAYITQNRSNEDIRACMLAFHNYAYDFYNNFFMYNKAFASCFTDKPKSMKNAFIPNNKEELDVDIKTAKYFTLYHEFEHILTQECPQVRENDMQVLNEYLKKVIDSLSSEYDVRGIKYNDFVDKVNKLINNEPDWQSVKEELYNDFHSYTEMMTIYARNILHTDNPIANADFILEGCMFLYSIKLYNMFRTFFSSLFCGKEHISEMEIQ